MRILVVSQYWAPEMGAPASRYYDLARHWIARGHRVSAITGFPSFATGVIPKVYRHKLYQHEVMDGIDVHRTYMFASPKCTDTSKAMGHSAFLVSSSAFALLSRLEYDVVVASSPPPTTGLAGWLAALRRGTPLVFDIRDIWPESQVDSGRIGNPVLIRLLQAVATHLYRSADLVAAVTDGKRRRLRELGVPDWKLAVLPNGVDVRCFDREADGPLPPDFDLLDERAQWLTYAGVFHPQQGLHVILDAARLLRERRPDLYARSQFVLIGGGSQLRALQQKREQLALDRLAFIPIQPRRIVFRALRRSFGVLVSLLPRQDDHTVPAKLYEALASSRPVILSADGEAAGIVNTSGCGRAAPAGDAPRLCQAIVDLLQNTAAADRMGLRGRRFVEAHFDRRDTAERFLEHFQALNSRSREARRALSSAGTPVRRVS